MSLWWFLSAGALAAWAWLWRLPQAALEAQALAQRLKPPLPWRARLGAALVGLAQRLPGFDAQALAEADAVGLDPARYLQYLGLAAAGAAVWCGVDVAPWAAPFGGAIGVFAVRAWLHRRWTQWLRACAAQVGDLVTLLKARLQAGDTVPVAMAAVAPQLAPPLGPEWQRALAALGTGQRLGAVLADLRRRLPDPDLEAVLGQLALYDREAVPPDPFGTLAAHLSHLKLVHRQYAIRQVTGSLTFYEGAAFLGALFTLGLPGAYVFWTHAVSGGVL